MAKVWPGNSLSRNSGRVRERNRISREAVSGPEIYEKFEGIISLLVNLKAIIMFGSSGEDPKEDK